MSKDDIIDLDNYTPTFDRYCQYCNSFVTGTQLNLADHRNGCLTLRTQFLVMRYITVLDWVQEQQRLQRRWLHR